MTCLFCGHSTAHGCWDVGEAANCGNMTDDAMRRIKDAAKAVAAVEQQRKGPSAADVERRERAELKRLKAKYEKRGK